MNKINLEKLKQEKSLKELLEFGILNIDKPAGMTSFDVSDSVRKRLKLRKTSHFGTLDPMVTGVLPIALNRAVKLTGFFLGEDKEYEGTMRIHKDVSLEEIRKAIERKFLGKIMQKPPVKSRVKRQLREREVKLFQLLEKKGKDITFRTEVQGGTYIRKLISDLGEYMNIGMHMIQLRRTRAGIFREKDSITKEGFEKAVEQYEKRDENLLRKIILPAEIISRIYKPIDIKKESVKKTFNGKPIFYDDLTDKEVVKKFKNEDVITVFSDSKFIGMFKVVNEKEVFAKSMFILQPLS